MVKRIKCDVCKTLFYNNGRLHRHLLLTHGVKSDKVIPCPNCDAFYSRKDSLRKHLERGVCSSQRVNTVKSASKYASANDVAVNNRKDTPVTYNVRRRLPSQFVNTVNRTNRCVRTNNDAVHNRKITLAANKVCRRHPPLLNIVNRVGRHVCAHCSKSFQQKSHLRRHINRHLRRNKVTDQVLGSMICVYCNDSFASKSTIFDHILEQHEVQIHQHHLSFASKNEFDEWKMNIQKLTFIPFELRNHEQFKSWSIITYICNRTGWCEVQTSNRKKPMRFQGGKELGKFCPAAITLQINVDGSCEVWYVSTHLCFDVPIRKTANVNISDETRPDFSSRIAVDSPSYEVSDYILPNLEPEIDILLNHEPDINTLPNHEPEADILPYHVPETDHEYCKSVLSDSDTSFDNEVTQISNLAFEKDPTNVEAFVIKHKKSILYSKIQTVVDKKYKGLQQLDDIVIVMMTPLQEKLLIKYSHKEILVDETFGVIRYGFLLHTFFVLDEFHIGIPVAFIISNRNKEVLMTIALESIKNKVGILRPKIFRSYVRLTYINTWKKLMAPVKFDTFRSWYISQAWKTHLLKSGIDETLENPSLIDCIKQIDLYLNKDADAFLKWDVIQRRHPIKLKVLRNRHASFEKELDTKKIRVKVGINNDEVGGWRVCISGVKNNIANFYHVKKQSNYCNSENCKLYCTKCDACQFAYHCECPDYMVQHYMCKHIHALCTFLKNQEKLTVQKTQKTVNIYAENMKFSHDQNRCHVHDDDVLQANDDNNDVLCLQDDEVLQANVDDVPDAHNIEESPDDDIEVCNVVKRKAYDIFMKNFHDIKTFAEAVILYHSVMPVHRQIEEYRFPRGAGGNQQNTEWKNKNTSNSMMHS